MPSPDQVRALITEATRPGAKNPELATIVLLAAITGMRRGELCGLQVARRRVGERGDPGGPVGMADPGRYHQEPQVGTRPAACCWAIRPWSC